MQKVRVGIDIGGTKVNIGLVQNEGEILCNTVLPSAGARDTVSFTDKICAAAETLLAGRGLSWEDVSHTGIGIPGTVDSVNGVILYSCNLFGDRPVDLASAFKARCGQNVTVVQDSWAAAWAEHCFGAGREHDSMLCMTIGTGIGCGVILAGRVFAGAMRAAGELGHVPVVWQGRPCSCGRRGCLEAYASGTAIGAQGMERFPEKLRGEAKLSEAVFRLAEAGDPDALQLIDECTDKLAAGISHGLDILSADTVIISGGISVHEKLVIEPLKEKIIAEGYPAWAGRHDITVKAAQLGPDAPMVGAAFLTVDDMMF